MITEESRLSEEAQNKLRLQILESAGKCVNIPYKRAQTAEESAKMIGKWTDYSKLPLNLDCSGLTNGAYGSAGLKLPHGSQNQYNFTLLAENPKPGDLVFFGRENGNPTLIYHVGILFHEDMIIECRELDESVSFPTGKVILRPRIKWEQYKNFAGYRVHPKLL